MELSKKIYEFGDFRLVPSEELLLHKGEIVTLNPKAFRVLTLLVERSGHLVEKSEIIDLIWEDSFVEEGAISKSIWNIRHALGLTSKEMKDKFIQTVPRRGYRFVAPVSIVEGSGAFRLPILPEQDDLDAEFISSEEQPSTNGAGTVSGNAPATEALQLDRSAEDEIIRDQRLEPVSKTIEHRPMSLRALAAYVGLAAVVLGGVLVARNWPPTRTSQKDNLPATVPADTGHSRAYDLYVRGKVKAGIENREETEAAIKLLEEAVEVDPGLAEAYAQLARVYNTKAFKFTSGDEAKQFYENAEIAIQKALELSPDLAEAHFARGLILWNNTKGFPHEQAIRSYKRSLELDPKQDETHHQLSMVYAHIGLMDEAERSLNKTLELNPNNTMARFRAGNYLAWQGKFEEALAVLKTVPSDVSPLLVERIKAEALIQTGRVDEALAIVDDYLNRYPNDDGGSFSSVKALFLAKAGKRKEAENAIDRAAEIGKGFGHFHHTAYNIASAYAALNEPEEAVKWLEAAAENGFPNYTYFEVDPNLNSIRAHPRFVEFMSDLRRRWEKYKVLA